MIKRFCFICIGLSMMGLFVPTTSKATDDPSTFKSKDRSKLHPSLPAESTNQIPNATDLSYRTFRSLYSFIVKRFEETNKRTLAEEEKIPLLIACKDSVQLLSKLFIAKKRQQDDHEPTPEEIQENFRKIDEYLRSRIVKGDFKLDVTEDLRREGYEIESRKDRYK